MRYGKARISNWREGKRIGRNERRGRGRGHGKAKVGIGREGLGKGITERRRKGKRNI